MRANFMVAMYNFAAMVFAVIEIIDPKEISVPGAVAIVGFLILGKMWRDNP